MGPEGSRAGAQCNICGAPVRASLAPRWIKDGFPIVACPVCGLLFRRALPTATDLEDIYDDAYFGRSQDVTRPENYLDYLAEEDVHRRCARQRLRRIGKWKAPGGLLDVGAAAGFFVDEAVRAGWHARGIDVAGTMTQWGRERLRVDLETGTFSAMQTEDELVDAVTMWDYIEHSLDPRADVEKALSVLRPGGLLVLSTGDAASPMARLSGIRWHLLTPRHHNFYFSPRTIRSLLYTVGFEIEALAHTGVPCSVQYCLHKLQTMAPAPRIARAADKLSKMKLGEMVVSVNLLDVMTVVARKPG